MYFEQNNPYGFENKSKDNQIHEDPTSNFNTKRRDLTKTERDSIAYTIEDFTIFNMLTFLPYFYIKSFPHCLERIVPYYTAFFGFYFVSHKNDSNFTAAFGLAHSAYYFVYYYLTKSNAEIIAKLCSKLYNQKKFRRTKIFF